MSIYEHQLAALLTQEGYPFVQQHKFHPERKWKLDFSLIPIKCKIGIEINGGVWTSGRHNRGQGYINDLEKINAAQILGWTILQYVPETMPNVIQDLKELKSTA